MTNVTTIFQLETESFETLMAYLKKAGEAINTPYLAQVSKAKDIFEFLALFGKTQKDRSFSEFMSPTSILKLIFTQEEFWFEFTSTSNTVVTVSGESPKREEIGFWEWTIKIELPTHRAHPGRCAYESLTSAFHSYWVQRDGDFISLHPPVVNEITLATPNWAKKEYIARRVKKEDFVRVLTKGFGYSITLENSYYVGFYKDNEPVIIARTTNGYWQFTGDLRYEEPVTWTELCKTLTKTKNLLPTTSWEEDYGDNDNEETSSWSKKYADPED